MKIDFGHHPALLAILLLTVCLLPLVALKDMSPSNELRYLCIAEEALENGSVFAFSDHGEPYADKPPLYLWLLMLSIRIFGPGNAFVPGLLSFVPAMVTVAVMDRWLMRISLLSAIRFTYQQRFAGAMMLGTSAMFLGTALVLRMDMLMTMFIVLSLYTFYKMYKGIGNRTLESWLLPVYMFLALFTKGPVGLLMPVAGIFFFLLLSGRVKETGRYLGFRTWFVISVLCGAWFLGVWSEGGTEYLNNLLFHQTIDRAIDAFHHKRPFWFYLVAIWYIAAPYSLLNLYAMFSRAGRQGYVSDAGRLFLICFVTTFTMLSAFSSKLAVYLLPVVPLMAGYTVLAVPNIGCNGWVRAALAVPSCIFLIAGLVMLCSPLLLEWLPWLPVPDGLKGLVRYPYVYIAGTILSAGAVLSMISLFRTGSWTGAVSFMAVPVCVAALALTPLVPQLNDYIGYRNLAAAASGLREASGVSGYTALDVRRAGNMDVLLDEDVEIIDEKVTVYRFPDISDTVLIVRTASLQELPAARKWLSAYHRTDLAGYSLYVIK